MSGVINNPGTKSGVVGGFDDVENTKLSTWTGASTITTIGTVTSGGLGTGSVIDDPTITQGSDATGDTYYRAANGKMTRLAAGTDGHPLTSTGAGSVPAFEAGVSGVLEYSKAHEDSQVSRQSTTAYNPGHYVTLNPTSANDRIRVNVCYAWHDETNNTAQRGWLYRAVAGGGYAENTNLGHHLNHAASSSQYMWTSHTWAKTASTFGWSTGTLQFKHYIACQGNSNQVSWNEQHGPSMNAYQKQDRWNIEAWRYSPALYTAGSNS